MAEYVRTPHEVARLLRSRIAGKVVCDLGCAEGEFLKALSAEASAVKGVEQVTVKANVAKNQGFTVENRDFKIGALPTADVYYSFLDVGGTQVLVTKILAENIRSIFIFGESGNIFQNLYLTEKGAVELSASNGDFKVYVWDRR